MLCGASSTASVFARPVTAARSEFDRTSPSIGCFTEIEVMLMMRPPPRACRWGMAPRHSRTTLRSIESIASVHARSSSVMNGPDGGPPVLVTRMSRPPNLATVVSRTRVMSAAWRRSASIGRTSPPAASIAAAASRSAGPPRAQMATRAPSRASASADARPSPLLAAQTRATLTCGGNTRRCDRASPGGSARRDPARRCRPAPRPGARPRRGCGGLPPRGR